MAGGFLAGETGGHAIDGDTLARHLGGEGSRQGFDGALGGRRGGENAPARCLMGNKRGDGDDAAAIGFLLAVFILRKVCTIQTGDWLNEHPPVAWLLVGLFWWLCLKPSGIGLGLMLMAILMAVRQYRQRRLKTVEQPTA